MPTWSGTRKKLETDYLCPALRGRVRYFATTYSKCPDHEGRAAILVDGVEVLKSSYYEYAPAFWKLQSELRRLEEADWREAAPKAGQTVLEDGLFDQRDFYAAFQELDNQSIEASLASENPIVRIFALLDRRLGKRRLAALEETMEQELDWVRPFYFLRMEAEGVDTVVEIGPGKALSGFFKKTAPGIRTCHIDTAADFHSVVSALKGVTA